MNPIFNRTQKPMNAPALKEMPMPVASSNPWECVYGAHQAEILHRGTAYCRKCYDARNPYKQLIDS